MVKQKFSAPIEQIRLARIELRRALVLPDRFQRIAALLLRIAQRMMHFRIPRLNLRRLAQVRDRLL